MEDYNLSQAGEMAARFINGTNKNIFLTGKAGTGKTTFLKYIVQNTHKKTIVAAPTGIAAINAGGVTLHSLFQLPFGTFLPSNEVDASRINIQLTTPHALIKKLQMNKQKRLMLQEMELLIIDEVSMLRADLLDAIDYVLRYVRRQKEELFGGVQVLFIGDLLQLPPVVKNGEWEHLSSFYKSIYFFDAQALQENKPVHIELEKIYRQSDPLFLKILNDLRENRITQSTLDELNKYYNPDFEPEQNAGYIHLTTHNSIADEINETALRKLSGESFSFMAETNGNFDSYLYPVDQSLKLKKGAQVMFIKNDYSGEQRYFNGKIGYVNKLTADKIVVSFNDGSPATEVEKYTWENKRFKLNKQNNEIEEIVEGTFTHYPLKLAWAITVHKSQGLTFDKAIIDVSRAFAPGQMYVALSRLRSLQGLVLTASLAQNRFSVDRSINEFFHKKEDTLLLGGILKEQTHLFTCDFVMRAFDFKNLESELGAYVTTYNKDSKRSSKQHYKSWAIELYNAFTPVSSTSVKFQQQLSRIIKAQERKDLLPKLQERTLAAKTYFKPIFESFTTKIYDHIEELGTKTGVKKYIVELKELESLFFGQLQLVDKAAALIESTLKHQELTKKELLQSPLYKERGEMLKEKGKQQGKVSKLSTKEQSLSFYKQGMTIAEIAEKRGLTVGTVEGHFMDYVKTGEVDVFNLMSEYKVNAVLETVKHMGKIALGQLKGMLGDEYSYNDIRFALAYKSFLSGRNEN